MVCHASLWPIKDGKREAGGCLLSLHNCGCDGKWKLSQPPCPASSIAVSLLPCGSTLRKAAPPICLLSDQPGTYSRGRCGSSKASLTRAEPHRCALHSGKSAYLERVDLGSDWGLGSSHFSGPGHTCHRYRLFGALSSSPPDTASITPS